MNRRDPLAPLRRDIDRINRALLRLLNRRSRLANRIGRIKAQKGLPVRDPVREKSILDSLTAANPGPLDGRAIRALFTAIIRETRRLEHKAHRE